MNRITIIIAALFFVAAALPAQSLLTAQDSVFMYANQAGTKFIQHPVKKGQTLYAISKFYSLSPEEVFVYNPQLGNSNNLEIGQRLNIPVPNACISRYMKKGANPKKFAKIYYLVQPGETLYTISKKHFVMPIDSVKARNGLKNSDLSVGQPLFVGWFTLDGIRKDWRGDQPQMVAPTGGTVVKDQGVAMWQHNAREKGIEMNCLHRDAAIGSNLAVTFPVTRKRIYVKVIGRVPEGTPANIKMILSPAAAVAIGAKDPKVLVDMEYVK